jgi:GTPase SAR1 family protein
MRPTVRYKVLLLGPPGAGKTSLVRRLTDPSYDGSSPVRGPTLDFYTRHVRCGRLPVNAQRHSADLSSRWPPHQARL